MAPCSPSKRGSMPQLFHRSSFSGCFVAANEGEVGPKMADGFLLPQRPTPFGLQVCRIAVIKDPKTIRMALRQQHLFDG